MSGREISNGRWVREMERLKKALETADSVVIGAGRDLTSGGCITRRGLWVSQSSLPSGRSAGKTYEDETAIREMVLARGFSIAADGLLTLPDDRAIRMEILAELVPIYPDDGRMMTANLRDDARFVQDAGWYAASRRYELFLEKRRAAKTLYWEPGIVYNTQETSLLRTKMDKRQDMVISQKKLDILRWRSGASRLPRYRAEGRRCTA